MSKRTREAYRAAQQANVAASNPVQEVEPQESNPPPADLAAERPQSRNEPRDRAMQEIEALDLQRKGLQNADETPGVVEELPPDPVPATPDQILAAEALQPPEATAVEPPPEAPKTIKVKVNGEEIDAPADEVEALGGPRAYGIVKATQQQLDKAKAATAEAKQHTAAIAQWIAQQQRPAEPQITDAQFIAQKMDAIRFGTPEESAAAMMEVMQRGNPRVNEEEITLKATAAMRYQMAIEKFKDEFKDVVNNPLLARLAGSLRDEGLRQVTYQTDFNEFFRHIGNQVRSVSRPSQSSATPAVVPQEAGNTSPVSDKEARKGTIVNLPTAAARAETPKEAKPETRADIFAEMRKSRGLPVG